MRTPMTANVLVGAMILVAVAAPCVAQSAGEVEGQGPPVFPVEIAAPLPVPVEGIVAGTVDANVTNTPTVHVGNPVTLVDPRTPFQARYSSDVYGDGDYHWRADSEAVPEGMRLVLHHVSTSYLTSSETLGIAELWHCDLFVLPEPAPPSRTLSWLTLSRLRRSCGCSEVLTPGSLPPLLRKC